MGKRILVVDDDEGILEALKVMLEIEGYNVETSQTADRLRRLDDANPPQLILLDVLLSGEDGRELCKVLKRDNRTKDIPVIMISAHPTARSGALASGAEDFISKPFEMDQMLEKVAQYTV